MVKLSHLLLVDDDPTTNFFNRHLLEKMNVCEVIHEAGNGQEALDKIEELRLIGQAPDMILLDINMPIMNGFEFLEQYAKLDHKIRESVVICMLTTSLAQTDLDRSNQYAELNDYIDKPLSEVKIRDLIEKYFG
jgi:CheY-like chemotaxis protein